MAIIVGEKMTKWNGILWSLLSLGILFIAVGSWVLGMAFTAWNVAPILDKPPPNLYHHYAIGRMPIGSIMILTGVGLLSVTRLGNGLSRILGIAVIGGGSFVVGMEFMAGIVAPTLESLGDCPLYLYHAGSGVMIGFFIILMGIVIFVKSIFIKGEG